MAEESGEKPDRDARGRFLPGQSGNPAGRPPGRGALTRAWIGQLGEAPTDQQYAQAAATAGLEPGEVPRQETVADLLAWLRTWEALRGNLDSFREIGDRVDPKPRRVEVSGPGGGPLRGSIGGAPSDDERREAEGFYDELEPGDGA